MGHNSTSNMENLAMVVKKMEAIECFISINFIQPKIPEASLPSKNIKWFLKALNFVLLRGKNVRWHKFPMKVI